MTEDFDALCAALWRSLGLSRPRARGQQAVLTVDDRAITLSPTADDRHVVVSAACGRLAEDPVRRMAQMRRLLGDGLGLVVSNPAVLHLRPEDGSAVAVQALCPCRSDAVAQLTKAIEDVLQSLDIHAPTLNDDRRDEAKSGTMPFASDESLIFRL